MTVQHILSYRSLLPRENDLAPNRTPHYRPGEPDPWAWTPDDTDPALQDYATFRLDRMAAMRAAVALLPTPPGEKRLGEEKAGWRPIESAPKDGTPISLADIVTPASWNAEEFGGMWEGPAALYSFSHFTHWRPLPGPRAEYD